MRKALFVIFMLFFISCNYIGSSKSTSGKSSEQDQKEQCKKIVKGLYEEMGDTEVDIVALVDEDDIYKIIMRVKSGDQQLQEIFVNRNCTYVTDKMIKIDSYQKKIQTDKAFVKCLASKEVRVFGNPQEASTVQQVSQLGLYGSALLINCGANKESCENMGVKDLPTTAVGNQAFPGVRSREWFEAASGCKYGSIEGVKPAMQAAREQPALNVESVPKNPLPQPVESNVPPSERGAEKTLPPQPKPPVLPHPPTQNK